MTEPDDGLLYLSREAALAAGLTPAEGIAAIERVFAAHHEGRVTVGPKARVPVAEGHFFQAMPGMVDSPAYAGMKWFSVVPENPARGLPNVSGLIVLADVATGQTAAIVHAVEVTALRTAAMTAAAAKRLAPRDAETAAFIGCGAQARSHAAYLREIRPGLRRAALLGRGKESRDTFARHLRDTGWEVRIATDGDDVLKDARIAVSTVPEYPGWRAFLDARLLMPGAFAAAVDLGRSWMPEGRGAFDLVATDDAEQSRALVDDGKLKAPREFDADLAALASGAHPGRRKTDERVLFVFAGHVLGDLAVAAAIYRRALAKGLGIRLPR